MKVHQTAPSTELQREPLSVNCWEHLSVGVMAGCWVHRMENSLAVRMVVLTVVMMGPM